MTDSERDLQKALIRYALREDMDVRLSEIDRAIAEDDPRYAMTEEEQRWMQQAVQHGLRKPRRIPARTVIVAAVIIALLTLLVSAIPLHHLLLQDFDTYTRVSLSDGMVSDWDDAYEPTVFPESYTDRALQISRSQRVISYSIGGELLTFAQCRDGNFGIDTERTGAARRIKAGDFDGRMTANGDEYSLYWTQDGFLFALSGNFPESDLLATAQSVQDK